LRIRQDILLSAAPAWPTLIGVQLVVVAVLVGAGWRAGVASEVRHTPLETQVLDLDPAAAAPAVDAALARQQRRARALLPTDESRTKSFLSLMASAAGLDLLRSEWTVAPDAAWPGVLDADLRVELTGDAFDLPSFLDGLHRQSAAVRVRAVAVSVAPGGAARAAAVLRYHRPVDGDAELEVARQVARTVPAATDPAQDLLARAADLARWRHFAEHSDARAAASELTRQRLARELPAALVAVRTSGGEVHWSAGAGAVATPRPGGH